MTIKLLMGGSPCTAWSIAQKNNRETEPSGMGWELFKNYLIAKEKFQPDFFLYENNKSAAQAIKDQISHELGVPLQHINSALVSAQNRQRFYAHNLPNVPQPEDRGILLKDILESGADWQNKSYALTTRCQGAIPEDTIKRHRHTMVAESVPFGENKNGKAYCLDANYFKGMDADKVLDYKQRTMVAEPVGATNGKAFCLTANYPGAYPEHSLSKSVRSMVAEPVNITDEGKSQTIKAQYGKTSIANIACYESTYGASGIAEPVCMRYERSEEAKRLRKQYEAGEIQHGFHEHSELQPRTDGKTNTLSTVLKDNPICEPVQVGLMPQNSGIVKDSQATRIYDADGKSVSLKANGGGWGAKTGLYAIPVDYELAELSNEYYHGDKKGQLFGKIECDNTSDNKGQPAQGTRVYTTDGKSICLDGDSRKYIVDSFAIPVEFDGNVPIKAMSRADGKTYTVYCVTNGKITIKEKEYDIKLLDGYYIIRKLTVTECCRLQGMPDWWFLDDEGKQLISNTQCYKGLGNGWQKDTVQHIMSYLPVDKNEKIVLLSLYDGIGTARKILEDLGYKNVLYIAYEIDKYCITVTSYRYPDVIHMGNCFDIRNDDWSEKYVVFATSTVMSCKIKVLTNIKYVL